MIPALRTRLRRLEAPLPRDPLQRWLASLTIEQLEAGEVELERQVAAGQPLDRAALQRAIDNANSAKA